MIFADTLVWMFFSLLSIGKSGFGFWKTSESGFHGFPFYRSIGKPEKGFAKLLSWTVVFFLRIIRARARPLFLRIVFQILFRISEKKKKKKRKESKYKRRYLSFETSFRIFRWIAKSEIRILKSKSRFPNHRTHPMYSCLVFWNSRHWG